MRLPEAHAGLQLHRQIIRLDYCKSNRFQNHPPVELQFNYPIHYQHFIHGVECNAALRFCLVIWFYQ